MLLEEVMMVYMIKGKCRNDTYSLSRWIPGLFLIDDLRQQIQWCYSKDSYTKESKGHYAPLYAYSPYELHPLFDSILPSDRQHRASRQEKVHTKAAIFSEMFSMVQINK
jgi:hypothetical protein